MAYNDQTFSRPADSAILLLGRVLVAYLFLPSGFAKLMTVGAFAASLTSRGIPEIVAFPFACLGAATEFFGSLAILAGFQFSATTLLLAAFTVVATLISHRYWEFQDAARRAQEINFGKNLAIIGGLLTMFVAGPGRYSVFAGRAGAGALRVSQREPAAR